MVSVAGGNDEAGYGPRGRHTLDGAGNLWSGHECEAAEKAKYISTGLCHRSLPVSGVPSPVSLSTRQCRES